MGLAVAAQIAAQIAAGVATHTARPGGVIPAARPPRKQPAVGPAPAAASQVPDLRSCTLHSWESCTARWGAGNAISEAEHGVGSSGPCGGSTAAPGMPLQRNPAAAVSRTVRTLPRNNRLLPAKGEGELWAPGRDGTVGLRSCSRPAASCSTPCSTATRCRLTEGGWAQAAAERHKKEQCERLGRHGVLLYR